MTNKNRVLVAMSGGIDSSVAALILKNKGYEVIGVTIKTWTFSEEDKLTKKESGCCSLDAFYDAKNIAVNNNFTHFVMDFTESFRKLVIDNFINEYKNGRTPNPCVRCNKYIKWEELLKKADELDAFYIATGHYANITYNLESKRFMLKRGKDFNKDQAYALWQLDQEYLKRTIFPLGELEKTEVRELGRRFGLKNAEKKESQEICFVTDNNYESFLKTEFERNKDIIKKGSLIFENKVVGQHEGIPFYTIGQRRGLNIALGYPVYVKSIDVENNSVVLGDENELYTTNLTINEINYVSKAMVQKGENYYIKIRYSDKPTSCTITSVEGDSISIELNPAKKAVTPGQSAVLFDDKGYLIAGGIIR